MPVSRPNALAVVEDFKQEFPVLANLNYVLLATDKDFHDHYGEHAREAISAWRDHLAAYERSTQTILVSLAAHGSTKELQDSLSHEGVGHSGINTFTPDEKRSLLDALMAAREKPGVLRSLYWKGVEASYAGISRSEQAEEVFCAVVEHALQKRDYHPEAFQHAWNKSILSREEPLKVWGVMQVAQHLAQGLRDNTRRHQIFPLSDMDQFRAVLVDSNTPGLLDSTKAAARRLLGKEGAAVREASGSGVYVGAVIGETPTHWIQRLSPNTAVLHDKRKVSGLAVGQAGTLRYRDGLARMADGKIPTRVPMLSR